MRLSSSESFSVTFCAGSGVSNRRAVARELPAASNEEDRAGEGVSTPASGAAANRMVPITKTRLELHLYPRHFIELSAPLDGIHCRRPASRAQRIIRIPPVAALFEIFIALIDSSDAESCSVSRRCFGRGERRFRPSQSFSLLFYSTVTITFPRACPCSRYRIASGSSLSR